MAVPTFTKSGSKAQTPAKLDKRVFGVEVENHELLKTSYLAYLAAGRQNLAKTLRRGEVSGGGRKPFRQKGTGNARAGSIRSPLWSGGGVTFGPLGNENYLVRLSKKSKRLALKQALTLAAEADKIIVIDDLKVSSGKTKDAVKLFTKIGVQGRLLIVIDKKVDEIVRPLSNLGQIRVVTANYLTVYDVLNADRVVLTRPALELLNGAAGSD